MQVRSVTLVTRYIKALIESDLELADLWIEGEISNFKRATSGHCYFTLKDSEAEIRCVMWRNAGDRLEQLPEQGAWVEAHGYVSVYERGGVYQFYVDQIEHGGLGSLWRQFLALKARLEQEGLFDPARKRPLPVWPRVIGLVTSPSGAARRDIENVLRQRYPLVAVILSGSLVQGAEAPEALCLALQRLYERSDLDLIILARGGGALEDLWAFNDERVARAIASSPVPVISGIGHETDLTIADLVADVRAPTPSAAAAAAVPDQRELRQQLAAAQARLGHLLQTGLARRREQLAREQRLLRIHDPRRWIAERRQRVDEAGRRLSGTWHQLLAARRLELNGCRLRLRALDPILVLQRGYAIVEDAHGVRVASVAQVAPQDLLKLYLSDGNVTTRVTDVRAGRDARPGPADDRS